MQASVQNDLPEEATQRVVLNLSVVEALCLSQCSQALKEQVDTPIVWRNVLQGLMRARHLRPTAADDTKFRAEGGSWRSVCCMYEQLWHAWRGSPSLHRLDIRAELQRHRLADLDPLQVIFLTPDVLAIGHSKGAVSLWELVKLDAENDSRSFPDAPSPYGHPVSPPPSLGQLFPTDSQERSPVSSTPSTASLSKLSSPNCPTRCSAQVLGIFQTTTRFEVQDLTVYPPAAAEPAAVLLGQDLWLAAAVGPHAFIWQCENDSLHPMDPSDKFKNWSFRGTLSHSRYFSHNHHVVWSVRIGGGVGRQRQLITVGEDCLLRAWSVGAGDKLEGELLWQQEVGDARQAVAEIMPWQTTRCGSAAVVARADTRTLQAFDMDSGRLLGVVDTVWPGVNNVLPQTATLDSSCLSGMFSSMTSDGDGLLKHIDLEPFVRQLQAQAQAEAVLRWDAERDSTELKTMAGDSRVPRLLLSVPAADILVAIVSECQRVEILEIWERRRILHQCMDSMGVQNGNGPRLYRGRGRSFWGNPKLMTVGGNSIVLLDPSLFTRKGELMLLEWRPKSKKVQLAPRPKPRRGPLACFEGCAEGCTKSASRSACSVM